MRIIRKMPLAKNRKLGISAFVLPVLLATVFLLPGCNMFNKPLSDFLEYWTDVAQINRHSFDGSYLETGGLTNLPSGGDRVITCYVINPQNYVLTPSATFASGSLTQGSDYSIEQDASDRTVLRLTLKDSYLQTLDGTGTGISPTVSIMEPNSGRNFGSYSVPLRVNSAPDGVKSPVVLRSGSSPETYILCFNMPDATKANGDIETISVDGNSFNRTYTVDMQNGTISGTGTIYTTKNASWQPVVNGAADFIGDESNIEIHYYLRDSSHSLDAFIHNRAQFEFLAIAREIASAMDFDLQIEVYPLAEGGIKQYFKLLPKDVRQISIGVITALITRGNFKSF